MRRELEELNYTTHTPGWDVLKEMVALEIRATAQALLDPTAERKGYRPDDFLRGYVRGIEFVMNRPQQLIEEGKVEENEPPDLQDVQDSA